MTLELKQQLRLSQQLVITPQLQQAIKLLQLSRLELLETIHQEMETNPLLEEVQEEEQEALEIADQTAGKEEALKEVEIVETVRDDFDWEAYLEEYSSSSPAPTEPEPVQELPSLEQRLTKKPSLKDHLMWQLRLSNFSDIEKEIGAIIIGNLDSNGYLTATLEEISKMAGASVERVESVLGKIQTFDPVGVAARNLQECLLIQIKNLDPPNPLAILVIEKYLRYLETKNYVALARLLKRKPEEVKEAIELILSLDPRPGSFYDEGEIQYVIPDIYVIQLEDDFVVFLNEDGMPKLRVNNYYKEILAKDSDASEATKEYIQNKLRSATWLIKSIHQRQRTLYKVACSIVKFQREFFEKGVSYLKPMVLRDVAEDVGMHESTISRVTTNKYMHTPQGIFELKYFFNSSINRVVGSAVASESVKERIRQIIRDEDPKKPLSDKEIVEILRAENINIARRTVAKYREMMNILPSHKRKRII